MPMLKPGISMFILLFAAVATADANESPAETTKLPFDTYSGYFVSNHFEPGKPQSFRVIANQKKFDKMFQVAMVMGDTSHRLPKDAFEKDIVLTTIKRGKAFWKYQVESVTVNDRVVELRYTVKKTEDTSASFVVPLIVSIPKGDYTAVRFVENNKTVKKLGLVRK